MGFRCKTVIMAALFTPLCTGCGPLAVALGLQKAFEDDNAPDLVNPTIEIQSPAGGPPSSFVPSTTATFSVQPNKSGIALGRLLVGPGQAASAGPLDSDGCPAAALFTPTGDAIVLTGLTDLASYTLWVRGEDPAGRVTCEVHAFEIDTQPPGSPTLLRVEANEPRELKLVWSQPIDAGSGIQGYNIYYDVGGRMIPDTRPRTPGATYEVPVFVSGASSLTGALSGLFACRAHYLNVTAIDRAGNESALSAVGELIKRTRAGGDGTFFPPVAYAAGTSAKSLNATDVDGDGVADIIASNVALQGLVDALGRPTGTFAPADWPTSNPIVVDDFNGDRVPDIVLGDYSTYFGDGDGGFKLSAQDAFPASSQFPRLLSVGTGASRTLVRATDHLTQGVTIESGGTTNGRGNGFFGGGGGFDGFARRSGFTVLDTGGIVVAADGGLHLGPDETVFVGADPFDVAAADLNDDRIEDLVTSNHDGSVSIVLGQGDGEFGPPTVMPVGASGGEIALADFDSDSILDVVIAGSAADSVSVLLGTGADGRGDGGLGAARTYFAGSGAREVAVADFNGDGIVDLVVAGADMNVLIGRGATAWPSGGFALKQTISVDMRGLALDDVNGDGIPDLIGCDLSGDTELDPGLINVMLGKGEEAQGDASLGGRTKPSTALFAQVSTADFDGDGFVDLIASTHGSHSRLLGLGTGAFRAPVSEAPLFVFAGSSAGRSGVTDELLGVALADFDGDGTPELVSVSGSNGGMVAVDLNDDAILDLAAADYASGTINIRFGRGDGTFPGPTTTIPTGAMKAGAIAAVDLNGDRVLDLVVGDHDALGIHAVLGIKGADGYATGTFGAPTTTALTDRVLDIVVGDLDRDGTPELIVVGGGGFSQGPVSLLRSNRDGTFTAGGSIAPAGFSPVLADLNNDTILDLILGDFSTKILLGTGEVRGD